MALPVPGGLTRRVDPNVGFGRHPTKETFVLIRLAALLLALAGPAAAQDYNQPDIVRGLCQKDGCDEFRVLSAEPVTSTDEGRLLRTRIQTFHASSRGRADRGEENGYVYCSRTKPAIMAEQNGQTMAFFLAPFATQESRESVRQNANFHALYFAICHDREAGKAAVHNPGSFGSRLFEDGERLVAMFGEVLLALDGTVPPASMDGEGGVSQRGAGLGGVAGSGAAGVLAAGPIADVVQAVLDSPMPSRDVEQ